MVQITDAYLQMTTAKQNDTLNGILYEMTNFIRTKKKWLNSDSASRLCRFVLVEWKIYSCANGQT